MKMIMTAEDCKVKARWVVILRSLQKTDEGAEPVEELCRCLALMDAIERGLLFVPGPPVVFGRRPEGVD